MTDRAPLISLIIPVHNVAGQIAEAVASVRAQTLTDFEVLLIDDGSTDASAAVARAAIGDDRRFSLIRQENIGLSGARNAGLDRARGEFIAFLDGDDALEPGFLAALYAAIQRESTDWAACAILLTFPDGAEVPHPALHGGDASAPCLDLHDARATARVFASAWNKLYRRALLAGVRYPQGSWFEDHEVFWAIAARAPRLAYVDQPLYRHRRDRPGQITGTDSDRVFEQLAVLERLHPLLTGGAFAQGPEGFARLATRLVHERAMVLHDPARRARFLQAVRALFDRLSVPWRADWDAEISRALPIEMAGGVPLSVVLLPGADTAGWRGAMAQQAVGGCEVVQAQPGERCAALAARLAADCVVLVAPGEVPVPDGPMRLINALIASGAPMAMGGLHRETLGYHDGWTDNRVIAAAEGAETCTALGPVQALRLYPALSNRVMRRALLAGLPDTLALTGDAGAVQALVLASALAAGSAGVTPLPVTRITDAPVQGASIAAVARWAAGLPEPAVAMPRGWRAVLFWRQVRLQGPGIPGWAWAILCATGHAMLRATPAAQPDPETPALIRRLTHWLRRSE